MKTANRILAILFSVIFVLGCMSVMAFADDEVIPNVSVVFSIPEAGDKPSYTVQSSEPGKYTAEIMAWKELATNRRDAKKIYCGEYDVAVKITAKPGYVFEECKENSISSKTGVVINRESIPYGYHQETPTELYRCITITVSGSPFDEFKTSIHVFFANLELFFSRLLRR